MRRRQRGEAYRTRRKGRQAARINRHNGHGLPDAAILAMLRENLHPELVRGLIQHDERVANRKNP